MGWINIIFSFDGDELRACLFGTQATEHAQQKQKQPPPQVWTRICNSSPLCLFSRSEARSPSTPVHLSLGEEVFRRLARGKMNAICTVHQTRPDPSAHSKGISGERRKDSARGQPSTGYHLDGSIPFTHKNIPRSCVNSHTPTLIAHSFPCKSNQSVVKTLRYWI